MNPKVTNLSDENGKLTFRISNINVSLANAIRRIILSEIPAVVFRTSPHEKNTANIIVNTSRFNNEIVKQRLSCIPIHITDTSFDIKNYIIEIDKKNTTDTIQFATTEDIKVKNITNDSYLQEGDVRKMFPPDPITKEFIDIVRLRPSLSKTLEGEHIKLSCKLSIGNAKENSSFNVASTCCYSAAQDPIAIAKAWAEKVKEYKSEGKKKDEIDILKEDWDLLDAKRITTPDAFNFIIESVGVFSAQSILEKACQVMINKLAKFISDVGEKDELIAESDNTIDNCFDINLVGEDYTLGKVIEYLIFANYFDKEDDMKVVTYCGFIKPHPHIDKSIIRVAFKDTIQKDILLGYLTEITSQATAIYTDLKNEFSESA